MRVRRLEEPEVAWACTAVVCGAAVSGISGIRSVSHCRNEASEHLPRRAFGHEPHRRGWNDCTSSLSLPSGHFTRSRGLSGSILDKPNDPADDPARRSGKLNGASYKATADCPQAHLAPGFNR